jgi:hypothetical protein
MIRRSSFGQLCADDPTDRLADCLSQCSIACAVKTMHGCVTESGLEQTNLRQYSFNIAAVWQGLSDFSGRGRFRTIQRLQCLGSQIVYAGDQRLTIRIKLAAGVDAHGERAAGTDQNANTLASLRQDLTKIGHKAIWIMYSIQCAYPSICFPILRSVESALEAGMFG